MDGAAGLRRQFQLGLRRRPRDHDGSLPQGRRDAVGRRHRASTGPRNWTRTIPNSCPRLCCRSRGMAQYEAMSRKEKATVRRHFQGWQISQFMQGEQGALICAAKIVTQVPDIDSKFYAATQVIDEARHVESYKRLLEKFGVAYPMTAAAAGADRPGAARQPLGHDLPRHAGGDRGPGAGGLPADPRQRPEPAGRRGQRLCDAGREPARGVRSPGAARLLSAADPGRA